MKPHSKSDGSKELSPSKDLYAIPTHTSSSTTKPEASSELHFYDHIARQERGGMGNNGSNYTQITVNCKQSTEPNNNDLPTIASTNAGTVQSPNAETSNNTGVAALAVPKTESLQVEMPAAKEVKEGSNDSQGDDNSPRPSRISGSPIKNTNRVVVRPIAFKPVVPRKRNESSSPESASSAFTPISYDEGYSSHDASSRACSNSASTTLSRDSDTVYASPVHITTPHKDLSILSDDTMISDANFERLLQDKESEILKLRRTMELNESAIVRVHEQQRIEWENQMKDLAQEYHRRLRLQEDNRLSRESELRQSIGQLEIDNRQLAINVQQNHIDRDRQGHLSTQVHELKQRNTDLTHKLSQEQCECDRLRLQGKEMDTRIRRLQEQSSLGAIEQEKLNHKIADMVENKCSAEREHSLKLSQLKAQLEQQEQQTQQELEKFKQERRKWLEEKEKVMQYQKQLQKTYVQMYRRNNELEQQLCRINSRRLARLDTQSLQGSVDRYSVLDVDLESCPESFC